MAEALTSQEELAVEEFLSEVRSREHPHSAALVSQPTAVKFLMARKFDVSRAIDLFQAYKNTRIKEGIFNINPEEEPLRSELLSGKFTVLPGRDAKGAALALFTARLHRSDVTTHRAVLQAIIFQLDKAIESVDTQRDGLIFIYDMTNSSYGNFDYELCVKILDLLKGAFPARLKCVFIVSSPLWFRAPFAVLRLFVREKLRERVCTVKAHELSNYIPVSSLPEHLDGTSRYSHVAWIQSCVNTHAAPGDASTHPHDTHDCVGSLLLSYSLEPHNANAAATLAATQTSIDSHSDSPLQLASELALAATANSNCYDDSNANPHVHCGTGNGRTRGRAQNSPQSSGPQRNPQHWNGSARNYGVKAGFGVGHAPGHTPPSQSSRNYDECREEVSVHMPDGVGMNVLELVEHVKKRKKKGIYQSMKRYAGASYWSFLPEKLSNQIKTGTRDVLCLDQSRVRLCQLCDDEDETSDYINASLMDGYKRSNAYIATQGPLPKTFGDFWRMVWEQMVLIVVMTTRVVERGRVKCGQYWPKEEGTTEQHGHFLVRNTSIQLYQDFRLSHLELYNSQTGERREVSHYLYVSWPDFGVPKCALAMLDFREHVQQRQEAALRSLGAEWVGPPGGPPLVVHCSAGIGRTGTFCTLDICLSRLEDIGTVDVCETVRRMRTQRAFSIQTWDQYYFCYTAVIEYAQRRGKLTPVQWSDSDLETDSE
ncbi:tyrosine-protein phosphatase non-receptor type 9-like [Oncorhynchus kisutch]|uniref:tyrosine-protein phosphatase non-receptor type 9-like n=1 Tax=Oncorhynchus kisutch TaxID=8019 RepID=UPI0012DE4E07|nr:tyrosine-protein phosphatase non-receptor type 9-like [Oncorhynchus kisutch]